MSLIRSGSLAGCTALLSVFAFAPAACTQEVGGRLFNPAPSPQIDGLVAYELWEGSTRLIHFRHEGADFPLTAQPSAEVDQGLLSLGGNADQGDRPTQFSGDLAWLPVPDWRGRQWFAYVSGDGGGGLGLYLQYFDEDGALSVEDPIPIPTAGSPRVPAWSPDGYSLAFVAEGGVYLVPDVRPALAGAELSLPDPLRLTGAAEVATYPAWSPDGDYIAYSSETRSGGRAEGSAAINVVRVQRSSAEASSPIVVTPGLTESNETHPAWSHDGGFLAYYVDRGPGSDERDIGIVELQRDQNGEVFRGEVRRGQSSRLAEDVFMNEIRGPEWTWLQAGGGQTPAVVYVSRDENRGYPIMAAALEPWLDLEPSSEYEVALSESASWGTELNKYVSTFAADDAVQFVFVSQAERGGEELQVREVSAPWLDVQVVASSLDDPVEGGSMAYAFLFPGAGQLQQGETAKGVILGALGAGAAAYLAVSYADLSKQNDLVVDAAINGVILSDNPVYQDWKSARNGVYIGAGALAATWLYGIIDAAVGGPDGSGPFALSVAPTPFGGAYPTGRGLDVGIRIDH